MFQSSRYKKWRLLFSKERLERLMANCISVGLREPELLVFDGSFRVNMFCNTELVLKNLEENRDNKEQKEGFASDNAAGQKEKIWEQEKQSRICAFGAY